MQPVSCKIVLVDYDPQWPELFRREAARIHSLLGEQAIQLEHTGSTAVPGLAAKPIIDMLLVVADSADETTYMPLLERAGYRLSLREPDWYEHRLLKGPDSEINLHVLSAGCPEIARILLFRDWLRRNAADRDRYSRAKLALAQKEWSSVDEYAHAKSAIVKEILERAMRAES